MCAEEGVATAASVVDHVDPHNGDHGSFWTGALQSLCEQCHNRTKSRIEHKGFSTAFGTDGLPIDPRHPFNSGSVPSSQRRSVVRRDI
jgi:hypothetical protein